MKLRIVNYLLLPLFIFIIFATVFHMVNGKTEFIRNPRHIIYDDLIETAFNNMSKFLREGETIVINTRYPLFVYYSGHDAILPWGARDINDTYSVRSLANYMYNNSYNHLAIWEGRSSIPQFDELFSKRGISKLYDEFNHVGEFSTRYGKIHLFKLKITNTTNENLSI